MSKETVVKYVLFIVLLSLVVLVIDKKNRRIAIDVSYRELPKETIPLEKEIVLHVANSDDLIIPLHITVNRSSDYQLNGYEDVVIGQDDLIVYYTFSLLTNISNHLPEGVKTLIPRSTKLLDYEKNGKYLTLNVSRDFYDYSKTDERLMLSIISHTFKETLDVEFIKILVDGRIVRYQDYEYVWVYYQDFRLNPVNDPTDNHTPIVVYYYVPIEESYFLAPVTYYIHPLSDAKTRIEQYLTNPGAFPVWSYPDDEMMKERQYLVTLMENDLLEKDESIGPYNEYPINLY